TLGAAAGTALVAFWLPGAIGVYGAYATALAALALAGAGALALARRGGFDGGAHEALAAARPEADAARAPRGARARRRGARGRDAAAGQRPGAGALGARALLALAGLSGFGPFAAQVLLVQAFAQVLNQSSFAFGAVLVVVLLAVAAAGLATTAIARR